MLPHSAQMDFLAKVWLMLESVETKNTEQEPHKRKVRCCYLRQKYSSIHISVLSPFMWKGLQINIVSIRYLRMYNVFV